MKMINFREVVTKQSITEMVLEDLISRFDMYGVIHIQNEGGRKK